MVFKILHLILVFILGTSITVYHDFHDEVRLYQQHWWRCNGPCQNRKPYFGMVRRATNRAPGPNDRWWGEHSRNCGGTFIKVSTFQTSIFEYTFIRMVFSLSFRLKNQKKPLRKQSPKKTSNQKKTYGNIYLQ